jgi:hypothetical protein
VKHNYFIACLNLAVDTRNPVIASVHFDLTRGAANTFGSGGELKETYLVILYEFTGLRPWL